MNLTIEMKQELLHILKTKKILGIKHVEDINLNRTNKMMSRLPQDINGLEEYVTNCSLCELSKSKISSSFGIGDSKSKIYFLGVKSTTNDEKEFDILSNMLKNVLELNVNDVYMTNIIKCRLKTYKNNLDEEITKCMQYIAKQIEISEPEIIITFGKAFNYLLSSYEDVFDVSGNVFLYNNIKVIPLLEIGFINKNPSFKEKMFIDLKKIKKILEEK
ncbi:MAG: uracil-DNA glycosylase family protein [Arcobacteraceae bacterium]